MLPTACAGRNKNRELLGVLEKRSKAGGRSCRMNRLSMASFGGISFALGLVVLGAISAASGDFVFGLQPLPAMLRDIPLISTMNAILLICLSLALFFTRLREISAKILAIYFFGWLLAAHLPRLAIEPLGVASLVALLDVAAITAVLPLVAMRADAANSIRLTVARACYGTMLVIFGAIHFKFHQLIASMIPGWIPLRENWPWVTGSINIAAGLSLVTGVKMRVGGAIVGLMYASWVPIVNLPRNAASPENVEEWTMTALTVALAGAAWLIAGLAVSPNPVRGRR
jgi:uncharacterized membrane protein